MLNKKIQIFLAEDEPAILRGLAANITSFSRDYEITGTAYNGAEALEKIQKQKPDIVITDIRMPVMDGLDLIEAARETAPELLFVILTGYAEFEYAKRAMTLQVTDYLLKPVDQDALETLLFKLKEQLFENTARNIRHYLVQNLYQDRVGTPEFNPLSGTTLYLLFAFYGAVTTGIYSELTTGSRFAHHTCPDCPDDPYSSFPGHIFSLRGNHKNETIFAIIPDSDTDISASDTAALDISREIYQHLLTTDTFVSCILSAPLTDGLAIPEAVRSSYLYAASCIVFGKDHFFISPDACCAEKGISVTCEVRTLMEQLKPVMPSGETSALCSSLIRLWEDRGTTQLQLQTDLRFVLDAVNRKAGSGQDVYLNPSELLASSSSYEDLHQALLLELGRLCAVNEQFAGKVPHTHALALKVRDYLDDNYTHPVTYKNFPELFGYHEKYISFIFKEEFGLSPSKYMLKLRLTAAKNLMQHNPDILLKDVAEAVGYEDQLYFSRVFKNSTGMSPKAYLKQLKG